MRSNKIRRRHTHELALQLRLPSSDPLCRRSVLNETAPTAFYTLSLHDALPIAVPVLAEGAREANPAVFPATVFNGAAGQVAMALNTVAGNTRSEEHTSELQSRRELVCRLLLEKKKNKVTTSNRHEIE